MSRLSRLSTRAYGRLSREEQAAVDVLEFGRPSEASRGRAKTALKWRRTREETDAYALELLDTGLVPAAVADVLRVSDDYLRRVVSDVQKQARNPSIHVTQNGLTDSRKGIAHLAGMDLCRGEAYSRRCGY